MRCRSTNARVSTDEQDLTAQRDALAALGALGGVVPAGVSSSPTPPPPRMPAKLRRLGTYRLSWSRTLLGMPKLRLRLVQECMFPLLAVLPGSHDDERRRGGVIRRA